MELFEKGCLIGVDVEIKLRGRDGPDTANARVSYRGQSNRVQPRPLDLRDLGKISGETGQQWSTKLVSGLPSREHHSTGQPPPAGK